MSGGRELSAGSPNPHGPERKTAGMSIGFSNQKITGGLDKTHFHDVVRETRLQC